MKKLLLLFPLAFLVQLLPAQNITFPDSLAVIKNKVKSVKVYLKQKDGEKYESLYLVYDKQGRLIREGSGEHSYYYAYNYDQKGRRITTTQRSAKGEFIQKYTTDYNDSNLVRKTCLFQQLDTLRPSHIYFYNAKGEKIREEAYVDGKLMHLSTISYDNNGNPVDVYDSTAMNVTVRKNQQLTEMRTYDASNTLLHAYTYRYIDSFVSDITDSISATQVKHYVILYAQRFVREVILNGKELTESEIVNFKNEYQYVLPKEYYDEEYGLPVPEMINEHKLTRDKKGNIVIDELTQKQGSYSETYIYVYEYEFY